MLFPVTNAGTHVTRSRDLGSDTTAATLRFNEHTPASGCGQPTPIINHVPTSKSVTKPSYTHEKGRIEATDF